MQRLVLLALLSSAAPAPAVEPAAPATAAAPRVAELVARLAQPAPAQTAFTEVRWLGMLARPMVLSGALRWLGDGHLERHVTEPFVEHTIIDHGTVTVTREGEVQRQFDLRRAPQLGGLLAGFEGLLSGDAGILLQAFDVALQSRPNAWKLVLRPRSAELAESFRGLVAYGAGTEMRCLRMDETDGDLAIILLGSLAEATLPVAPEPSTVIRLCQQPIVLPPGAESS